MSQDATLTAALAEDLDGAFEGLVVRFQDPLYAFAVGLCGDRDSAEEIVQDALVRAYRGLRGYGPDRVRGLALRPWLYRVTLNVFRNTVRGPRARTALMERPPERESDPGDGPEAAAIRAWESSRLAAALREVPERHRTALVLKYVRELSYSEIAEVLGQPVGTVKANVHRGVESLRRALDGDGQGEAGPGLQAASPDATSGPRPGATRAARGARAGAARGPVPPGGAGRHGSQT